MAKEIDSTSRKLYNTQVLLAPAGTVQEKHRYPDATLRVGTNPLAYSLSLQLADNLQRYVPIAAGWSTDSTFR